MPSGGGSNSSGLVVPSLWSFDLFPGGAFTGDVYENILWENPIGQDKSWVVLKLAGTTANRSAIGARVRIETNGPAGKRVLHRTISTGGSFGSSTLQLEVGLDRATEITAVEVRWPNREQTVQVFRNLPIRAYVRITEGEDEFEIDVL